MDESKRIRQQRDEDLRDEALNPSPEAEQTGREGTDRSKAIRNTSDYDEFGSKKAGPGAYEDTHDMPLTERKMRKDAEIRRKEEMEKAEREKRDKMKRKRERRKEWGE